MTDGTLIVLAFAGLASITIVVVIWQLAGSWRAKAALIREDSYRELSERAIATQEDTQRRIGELGAELGSINGRLAAIERALTVID